LSEQGVATVTLDQSFRAVRPLQQAVNAAFGPEMPKVDAAIGQPAYVPLRGETPPIDSQPALVALPAPYPYGLRRPAQWAIDECLPRTVAAFVHWLLHDSQWKVRDPEDPDRLVPIQSQHIAILFRHFRRWQQDLTREYVRELEIRNI